MIDVKKIEDAAKKYAKEKEKICKELAEKYKSATSIGNWVTVNPDAAFEDGIDWFLKNLWHPASEMPDKNRICLVRVVYHPNHGMFQDEERIEQSSFHDFGWYDYDFKYIGTNYDIISWLYVDDLFPKEGGEQ